MTMTSERKITYQEFERLALNPENADVDSVFRLVLSMENIHAWDTVVMTDTNWWSKDRFRMLTTSASNHCAFFGGIIRLIANCDQRWCQELKDTLLREVSS